MRVIIFVPESPGSARTVRAVRRDVEAQGHEVAGITSVAAEAKVAYKSGVVDQIAGRPEHLIELAAGWAMPIKPRTSSTALAAVGAPVAWLGERSRGRPVRISAAVSAICGAALAALFVMTLESNNRPDLARPTASPTGSAAPLSSSVPPLGTTDPTPPAEQPPEQPGEAPPAGSERVPGTGGSGDQSMPASPSHPPAETGSPAPRPPTTTPPPPPSSSPPPPGNDQPERDCLLDIAVPGIGVRLCLG